VPDPVSFDYSVIRVAPRVEREEFINAGIVLYCLKSDFLGARVALDVDALKALDPDADVASIRQHLDAIPLLCAGDPSAGPIARLPQKERWHWLTAPRSTLVQPGPVHSGLCENPATALEKLMTKMVFRTR
jgi:hypothetical protein